MMNTLAMRTVESQTHWSQPPPQVPAAEGLLDVGGGRIWYWDTGGAGDAVVLAHPHSASALNWVYQQPALAAAGYRVVAYSRRGHAGSDPAVAEHPGTGADDLRWLIDHLGIKRTHLLGLAAGADILPDFALSWPRRVLSLAIGCTIGKPGDTAWDAASADLLPDSLRELPRWITELGPSYRAAYPKGVLLWRELEAKARLGAERPPLPMINRITPDSIAGIAAPVLLFTGDADLYMPPPRLRAYARYWANPEIAVFAEAGHSVYWEQYEPFNRVLLDFLQRHSSGARAMTKRNSPPRIPMADDGKLSEAQQKVRDKIERGRRGHLAGPLRAALHSPELAECWSAFGECVRFDGELPQRLRELAIVSVARYWNSQVEWAIHASIAAKEGLAPDIIEAIRRGEPPRLAAGTEMLVYEFVRQLLEFGQVADDAYQALHGRVGAAALVELTAVVGYYSLAAMTLNVHRVPMPEYAGDNRLEPQPFSALPHPARLPPSDPRGTEPSR